MFDTSRAVADLRRPEGTKETANKEGAQNAIGRHRNEGTKIFGSLEITA